MQATQGETCDYKLAEACRLRNGVTEAKDCFLTILDGKVKFACSDCRAEIKRRRSNAAKLKRILQ